MEQARHRHGARKALALEERRLLLKAGTIIAAPSSTKNATQTRDPEMKQAKKGHAWYFGMKVDVGGTRRVWCIV